MVDAFRPPATSSQSGFRQNFWPTLLPGSCHQWKWTGKWWAATSSRTWFDGWKAVLEICKVSRKLRAEVKLPSRFKRKKHFQNEMENRNFIKWQKKRRFYCIVFVHLVFRVEKRSCLKLKMLEATASSKKSTHFLRKKPFCCNFWQM